MTDTIVLGTPALAPLTAHSLTATIARFDGGTTYSQNHRGMVEYLDFTPTALTGADILASAQAAGLA